MIMNKILTKGWEQMKKSKLILCALLVLCLCLCMVLASCKEEPAAPPVDPTPVTEVEGPKGQLHLKPGEGGNATPGVDNPQLPGGTTRY